MKNTIKLFTLALISVFVVLGCKTFAAEGELEETYRIAWKTENSGQYNDMFGISYTSADGSLYLLSGDSLTIYSEEGEKRVIPYNMNNVPVYDDYEAIVIDNESDAPDGAIVYRICSDEGEKYMAVTKTITNYSKTDYQVSLIGVSDDGFFIRFYQMDNAATNPPMETESPSDLGDFMTVVAKYDFNGNLKYTFSAANGFWSVYDCSDDPTPKEEDNQFCWRYNRAHFDMINETENEIYLIDMVQGTAIALDKSKMFDVSNQAHGSIKTAHYPGLPNTSDCVCEIMPSRGINGADDVCGDDINGCVDIDDEFRVFDEDDVIILDSVDKNRQREIIGEAYGSYFAHLNDMQPAYNVHSKQIGNKDVASYERCDSNNVCSLNVVVVDSSTNRSWTKTFEASESTFPGVIIFGEDNYMILFFDLEYCDIETFMCDAAIIRKYDYDGNEISSGLAPIGDAYASYDSIGYATDDDFTIIAYRENAGYRSVPEEDEGDDEGYSVYVVIHYEELFNITINQDDDETVEIPDGKHAAGEPVQLVVNAPEGKRLKRIIARDSVGDEVDINEDLVFIMPNSDVEIITEFEDDNGEDEPDVPKTGIVGSANDKYSGMAGLPIIPAVSLIAASTAILSISATLYRRKKAQLHFDKVKDL